jgi:hypothetical protein
MLLGLPPAKYVVMPDYEAKLKQLLETANDMDAGLPLEYEITTLQVGTAHTDEHLQAAHRHAWLLQSWLTAYTCIE